MKFQDDISNMNTHIHTDIHADKPKPICPPLFQSWGHNEIIKKQSFVSTAPSGPGISGAFNFSIFKAPLKAWSISDEPICYDRINRSDKKPWV